ncbi:methionyl-tRNA formyltransferase [Virgibacillus siamensis]|uniref:Methionyl-tRNA formyltransferase n=1 Tax=Virgibacillus siamensis TaxID=480071 RepID=A0ABN1GJF7_9BACI
MKKIVFMGTPDFSVPILESLADTLYDIVLVVTQPDRPKGRKKTITPPPVKEAAERLNIPVYQPEKLRDEYMKILSFDPDLIITAAYGQILPNELLEKPSYGCINVHASLLPELRGGAPIHSAILQGKTVTGISIMYMAEKLDAGDVLAQQTVAITPTDHAGSLHDKLSETGAELLLDTVPKLENGNIKAVKQDESRATFAANIKRNQERIDWNNDSQVIYNQIRGLHPWPVAFTTYHDAVMKIWWGTPVTADRDYHGEPGEIVEMTDDEFIVQCGNQKGIRITEIQPAGKKRMSVKQYLQGSPDRIKTGTKMGE